MMACSAYRNGIWRRSPPLAARVAGTTVKPGSSRFLLLAVLGVLLFVVNSPIAHAFIVIGNRGGHGSAAVGHGSLPALETRQRSHQADTAGLYGSNVLRSGGFFDQFFSNPYQQQSIGAGAFQRKARSIQMLFLRRARLNAKILNPPEGPVDHGQQVVLACQTIGPRPTTVLWLKNGEPVYQEQEDVPNYSAVDGFESQKSQALSLSSVKSKLFIDCASADDAAEYTCVASSGADVATASYTLRLTGMTTDDGLHQTNPQCGFQSVNGGQVDKKSASFTGSPARITMWTQNKVAPMGTSVVLACRAQGSPDAAISWTIDETQRRIESGDNGRFVVRTNGDLEVRDLQWDDMGGYTCHAENDVGSDRQTAFLYPYGL